MTKFIRSSLIFLASCGIAAANIQTNPPLPSNDDLICPTELPADCYPKLFHPTEHFQPIREGQDLPPGLHIRMNVWTGEKEARLNIPVEDDIEQQLEGLPIEQSIVVVEQPGNEKVDEKPALRDQVPRKPPPYEDAGKIVPPRERDGVGGDSETLERAVHVLDGTHSQEALDSALSDLSDLAHDIYYGVELTRQSKAFERLLHLMSSKNPHHRRQAASILGKAIHNNPTALKEAQNTWGSMIAPSGESLVSKVQESLSSESDATAARAHIHLLGGLAKSAEMRDRFLKDQGPDLLLSIFIREEGSWDTVRTQISKFMMDAFLDEDMGAELGLWPRVRAAVAGEGCDTSNSKTREGCWEWHMERMGWSEEMSGPGQFLKLLRERRPVEEPRAGKLRIGVPADREL